MRKLTVFFFFLLIFIICFNKEYKQRITLTLICIFTVLHKKNMKKSNKKNKQGEDK